MAIITVILYTLIHATIVVLNFVGKKFISTNNWFINIFHLKFNVIIFQVRYRDASGVGGGRDFPNVL